MNETEVVEYTPPAGLSIFEACYLLKRKITKEAIVVTLMSLGLRKFVRIEINAKNGGDDFVLYRDAVYPKDELRNEAEGLILASIYENFDADVVALGQVSERIALNGISLSELEALTTSTLEEKGHIRKRTFRKFENSILGISMLLLILLFYLATLPPLITVLTEANTFAEINPDDYFLFPVVLIVPVLLLTVAMKRITVTENVRTESGNALLGRINGFHSYLSIAESKRINFFQSTEAQQLDIDELLPYAILFGLEKSWLREVFLWKDELQNKPI